ERRLSFESLAGREELVRLRPSRARPLRPSERALAYRVAGVRVRADVRETELLAARSDVREDQSSRMLHADKVRARRLGAIERDVEWDPSVARQVGLG